jgi:hypothetical protein
LGTGERKCKLIWYFPSIGGGGKSPYRGGGELPVPSYSTGHLAMPILQQNEVQHVIIKDIKQENSADAKNSSYRKCLVCGENNKKCGWFI